MGLFKVITWPEIQKYSELEGFEENSHLINDEKGIEKYGSLAFFVNTEWLNKHNEHITIDFTRQ